MLGEDDVVTFSTFSFTEIEGVGSPAQQIPKVRFLLKRNKKGSSPDQPFPNGDGSDPDNPPFADGLVPTLVAGTTCQYACTYNWGDASTYNELQIEIYDSDNDDWLKPIPVISVGIGEPWAFANVHVKYWNNGTQNLGYVASKTVYKPGT